MYINIYIHAAAAKWLQSCPTLRDPIDGSPPGSPVPGVLQARTLELVPFPSPCIYSWLTLKQRFEPPGYTYTWVFSNNKYHSTIQSQGIFLNVELSNTEEPRVLRDHVNHLFILRERRRAEKKTKEIGIYLAINMILQS